MPIPVDSGLIPVDSSGFQWNPVIPAGMVGGVTSTDPNGLPLPPGPKGYSLIGNLFDIPAQKSWVVYDEWRNTYCKPFTISGLSPKITQHFR